MSAPHFFLEDLRGPRVRLSGEDARHAARVLRLRPGEEITVADGDGDLARARVISTDPFEAEVIDRWRVELAAPRVIACPAVPKSGKLEHEVQKLTELGVDEIRPWVAARSVPRWDEAKAARHGERARAIARAASMQSRRPLLPVVVDPAPPPSEGVVVVCHEGADARLSEVLPADLGSAVIVITGPEGGLTDEEVSAFSEAGGVVASLGPTVLRAETAAVVAVVLVLGRCGRLG